MKLIFSALFSLLAFTAFAQNQEIKNPPILEYSLEVSNDTCFLIQKVSQVSKDSPRPTVTTSSIVFTEEKQYLEFMATLRKQAIEQRDQAKKLIEGAGEIEKTANKIEAVFSKNNPFKK